MAHLYRKDNRKGKGKNRIVQWRESPARLFFHGLFNLLAFLLAVLALAITLFLIFYNHDIVHTVREKLPLSALETALADEAVRRGYATFFGILAASYIGCALTGGAYGGLDWFGDRKEGRRYAVVVKGKKKIFVMALGYFIYTAVVVAILLISCGWDIVSVFNGNLFAWTSANETPQFLWAKSFVVAIVFWIGFLMDSRSKSAMANGIEEDLYAQEARRAREYDRPMREIDYGEVELVVKVLSCSAEYYVMLFLSAVLLVIGLPLLLQMSLSVIVTGVLLLALFLIAIGVIAAARRAEYDSLMKRCYQLTQDLKRKMKKHDVSEYIDNGVFKR